MRGTLRHSQPSSRHAPQPWQAAVTVTAAGPVMVLPTGVNKGTGLTVALAELGIAAHNVVGAGDAENDDSFLSLCGFSVAVANAIPSLKRRAHKTTKREHGAGVVELIQQIIASDG